MNLTTSDQIAFASAVAALIATIEGSDRARAVIYLAIKELATTEHAEISMRLNNIEAAFSQFEQFADLQRGAESLRILRAAVGIKLNLLWHLRGVTG